PPSCPPSWARRPPAPTSCEKRSPASPGTTSAKTSSSCILQPARQSPQRKRWGPSRDVGSPPKSGRPFTLVGLGIGLRVRLREHRLSDPVGRILVNPVLRSRSDTVHEEPVGTIGRNLHSVADLAA